ncbi:hypothetical protein N7466_001966 [Penicillium verhagenii]|uniref:uncharacterized protein n=1 Tax=Penicillium verhagenii TaxID=1562060 RepID=UPI002544D7C2|nr:uncharacterized protein N7466_001966 [Penicillium verhagenii]KAJ5938832.1 hypothetical protein N7466_001966 [Penicillium verhagenii]
MATLHDALECLKPTTWDDVPQSPDELRNYIRDIFHRARLVAESLPDPPPYENDSQSDSDSSSTPRVVPSSARVGETDPEITSLQKQWGKPIKMGGPKDNPLGVNVWKLSAHDGGGSWFGRRSVHEGMPFTRWQEKISSEYDETLKVNRKKIDKGQTPDKSIRGIGAERKVESVEVKDEGGSVIAHVTVYHVSAQFPKPTAPRDFVTMMITSDTGLRIGGTKQPGRSWLMISKPCDHPDTPHKSGYTRGEYESVELVREIPRQSTPGTSSSSSSAKSARKSQDSGTADSSENDPESNPVEWIMVTRSDPGGSIPRWMVDKGTPKSVGADAAKFVDWAIQEDKPAKREKSSQGDINVENPKSPEIKIENSHDEEESQSESDSESDLTDSDVHSHHGLIASVTGLVNSSLERYAPAVFDYIPHHQAPSRSVPGDFNSHDETADDAEVRSFKSSSTKASHGARSTTSKDPEQASLASARSKAATPIVGEVVQNDIPPAELMEMTKNGKLSSNEKELAKLALRKREIELKLDTIRADLDNMHISSQSGLLTPARGLNTDIDSDTSGMLKRAAENRSATPNSVSPRQSQRHSNSSDDRDPVQTQTSTPEPPPQVHKAAAQLLNEEAKLLKQLRKVEGSQLKVASKIEVRQRKDAERSEKSKSRSEVEGLRQEVKDLKKEVTSLRSERQKWVDIVAALQAENTKLAARNVAEDST